MLETELIKFGLSVREAKVYLTAIKIGEAPASVIAKRCGLPRLTVYTILERLKKIEIMESYEKHRIRIYRAASPETFLAYCDLEVSKIQARRERFRWFLPRLKVLMDESSLLERSRQGEMRFIEDRSHFQRHLLKALKGVKQWYVIHDGSLQELIDALQVQSGVNPRCLIPYSKRKKMEQEDQSVRYFQDNKMNMPVNFMGIGSSVFFVVENAKQFFAIQIENEHISSSLKTLIELLWATDFLRNQA